MKDQFTLTIDLGNDAMQTPTDVAGVLDRLSEHLRMHGTGWYVDEASMRDDNGNTVARWEVSA